MLFFLTLLSYLLPIPKSPLKITLAVTTSMIDTTSEKSARRPCHETSHVGGATGRTPPIPRSALEKDPRLAHGLTGLSVFILLTWKVVYMFWMQMQHTGSASYLLLVMTRALENNSLTVFSLVNRLWTTLHHCFPHLSAMK